MKNSTSLSSPFRLPPLISIIAYIFIASCSHGEQSYTENGKKYTPAPLIDYNKLVLNDVSKWRKNLIKSALDARKTEKWLKYIFGSSSPEKGGFDCSGAMHYVLHKQGLTPPRTSSAQYTWVAQESQLHRVTKGVTSIEDQSFSHLTPGDLVFWSGTYEPTDGRTTPVTHVGMYLGYLNDYPRPIMICSSKGRSFNSIRRDGYGVYDFKIPSSTSRAKIVGYGAPPRN